ncbi:MAG: type II toxin-antitoxin system VapC family toxin [Acetobacteraceae bacterium]
MVIDASLTLAWYFEDESTPAAQEVLDRVAEAGAMVPGLWRLEVANGFQTAIRRKRIDTRYRDASLDELTLLPIAVDVETSSCAWTTTLRLAERFSLSLYDATYLELAERRSLPLATLEAALRIAAPALGVVLLGLA